MKIARFIVGACLDLILFAYLVPRGTILAGSMLDVALFRSVRLQSPWWNNLGIAFVFAGAVWLLWALYLLITIGKGYITEIFCIRISPVTVHLVDQGPYAVHRHPLAVGYLAMLCGFGLILGSPGTIAAAAVALSILYFGYVRLFEEPCLKRRLGNDYLRYIETVPIFFPAMRQKVPVAFRNLRADPVRFVISVAGVAFAVVLICFQFSILKGTSDQITTYIDHVGADIWVLQKGVDDFIATSAVPIAAVHRIEAIPGVRKAAGIQAVYTLLEINRVKSRVYVVGYDVASGDGGPWKFESTLAHIKNVHDLGENEVFIDQSLARRNGLAPGDSVSIFGHVFAVAGLTQETTSIGSQYVFISRKAVSRILPAGEFAFTHILVWTEKEVPEQLVINRIEAQNSLSALSREQLAKNMLGFLGTFMLPLLTAGVVMGFLVGSATIGITLYTSVLLRFKEYGTMKALGAGWIYLYGLLLRQALIALALGGAIGMLAAVAANQFINQWVPGMTARLDGWIVVQTLAAGLVMALVSTGLPMWRLLKIDPLEAFRE